MTLAFCRCGHTRDQHRPGVGCHHENQASKRFAASARCVCARFVFDPLLDDAEAFIGKQLSAIVRKEGLALEPVDRDELLQVMRISLWRASVKYDSRSHIRFGSWAAFEVYNDAIDELRSSRMFGRHGQHRLPAALPSHADGDWNIDPVDPLDADDAWTGRLERVVAELTLDPPDVGSLDLGRALSEVDREALRAAGNGRRGTACGASARARRPAWSDGLTAHWAVARRLPTTTEEAA